MKLKAAGAVALVLIGTGAAQAQVKVGAITSATGPVASIGIPQKNTFSVVPSTPGGESVTYTVLDDSGNPAVASRLARKLISEEKVDLIIGPGSSPTASAVSFIASEMKTPMIALSLVPGEQALNPWVFSISLPTSVGMKAVAEHIKTTGAKSQALKVISTHLDAVFVGGGGTQRALPQMALVERGFKGQVNHTGAVVNPEFLRIGGKSLDGGLVYAGPFAAVDQLPESNVSKKPSLDFAKAYESKFGPGSRNTFAAYSWDAAIVAGKAATAPKAKAKPGTAGFRAALRDALESTKEVAGSQGVYTMSATDHSGNDQRSVLLLRITDGAWRLAK